MRKQDKIRLRTLFVGEYSEVLSKVRRRVKGVRIQHINVMMIIGERGECGASCIECADVLNITRGAMHNKIGRVMSAGFVTKMGLKYYLTDSGQTVYDTICKEFDVSFKKIVRALIEEANR